MAKFRYFLIGIIVIFLLAAAGYFVKLNLKTPVPEVSENAQVIVEISDFPTQTPENVSDWITYTDSQEGVSFKYPGNWEISEEGSSFPNGDLFDIRIIGPTQEEQTEFYDGALFAVMKPVVSDLSAQDWTSQQYGDNPAGDTPAVFTQSTFAGKTYEKAYVCGLGCFSYYHIKENGRIYGFLFFAEGPNEIAYTADLTGIMESVSFSVPAPSVD